MARYPKDAPDFFVYRYCPQCTTELTDATDPFDDRVRPTCPGCGWVYRAHSPIGVIAVIEAPGGLVFCHPEDGLADGRVDLAALFVDYGESPEDGIGRTVRERTGLEVEILDEITRFQQDGTPFGHALILGLRTRVTGGALSAGDRPPAAVYSRDALPEIVPTRLAMRKVFDTYLARGASA